MFKSDIVKSSGELLQEWLVKNSRGSKDLIAADKYDELNNITFSLSGCYRLVLRDTSEYVSFVHDHKKLWNYLTLSPPSSKDGNSFGVRALLFQNAIMYLFESRTILVVKYLSMYNSLVFLVMGMVQPEVIGSIGGNIFIFYVMYRIYIACSEVYKASFDSELLTNYEQLAEKRKLFAYSETAVDDSLQYTIHASGHSFPKLVWYFLTSMKNELYSLVVDPTEGRYIVPVAQGGKVKDSEANNTQNTENRIDEEKGKASSTVVPFDVIGKQFSKVKAGFSAKRCTKVRINAELEKYSDTTFTCAYYLLLNIGARFLATQSREQPTISKGTRYTILSILVVVPVAYAYNFLIALAGYKCVLPNDYNQQPWVVGLNCEAQYVLVVFTLGTATMYLQWVTISMSMVVAAVGMLHGSTIMHGLATSWVQRYSGLRQCRFDDDAEVVSHQQRRGKGPKNEKGVSKYQQRQNDSKYSSTNAKPTDSVPEIPLHINMNSSCNAIKVDEETSFSKSMMIRSIEADAYENYLFIQVNIPGILYICDIVLCLYNYIFYVFGHIVYLYYYVYVSI